MAMQVAQSTQITAPAAAGAPTHGLLATLLAVATVVVPAVIAVNVSPNADKIVVRCQSSTAGQQGQQAQACGVIP